MVFFIIMVAIALVTQLNFCVSGGTPPPGSQGGGEPPEGRDHQGLRPLTGSPTPGSRPSPQPGAGGAGGSSGAGSDPGAPRDGAGSVMSWLPFVIGGVAAAALLISLCAIVLVLWLCCLRNRWRGRGSGTPNVVVIERIRDDKPFVYVVGSEKEKNEEEIAPPPYPGNVPRRPIPSINSEFGGRPPEPPNYPPPNISEPSAPPNSTRRVQSPSTERGAGQVAKDKSSR